jgi:putative acetyltransferase
MVAIREIKKSDNEHIAFIIKSVLTELNYNIKGTAFYDKETDNLFEAYQTKNAVYFVAVLNNEIVGGCGINPLKDGANSICELQKMYILPKARGKKIGKQLIDRCLNFAQQSGYKQCYLETFPDMHAAINLYKKNGFIKIDKSLGNTCHYSCNVWMIKDLISE